MSNAAWLSDGKLLGKRDALNQHAIVRMKRMLLDGYPDSWTDETIQARFEKLFEDAKGPCCTKGLTGRLPLSRTDLSRNLGDGDAERCEAVQDGDTDLELGDLTVKVPCGEALTQQFYGSRIQSSGKRSLGSFSDPPHISARLRRC